MKHISPLIGCLMIISIPLVAQWSTSPSVNNRISSQSGEQVVPKARTHPAGDTYIAYFANETGDYLPWVQRMDPFGYPQWPGDGIRVSSHTSMTWITDFDMKVTPDNGAIVAFQDIRTGNNEVYAYKLSEDGDFVWGADGVALSANGRFNVNPVIAVNPDNSAVIAWPSSSNTGGDDVVLIHRLEADGTLTWPQAVILGEAGFNFTWPSILPMENNRFMIVCYKEWGPYWAPNRIILAQKYEPDGTPIWASPAVLFNGATPLYVHPVVTGDGSGGAFVAWYYEKISNHLSTFVNHVDNDGTVTMEANGTEACTDQSTLHMEPDICCDTATNDVYVFWRSSNLLQSQFGLGAQRLSVTGERIWGNNGITLVPLGAPQTAILSASEVSTGAVIAYLIGSATTSTLQAIRIDPDGNTVWTPPVITVSNSPNGKDDVVNGGLHNGQVVYAWTDGRNGNNNIYAQNLIEDGSMGPVSQSMQVDPDTLWFLTPDDVANGKSFTIYNPNTYMLDVQWIDPSGSLGPGLFPWYVEPASDPLPLSILPGETATRLVKWDMDGILDAPILYDTLNISTISESASIIVAVDSALIATAIFSPDAAGVVIHPNPARDHATLKNVVPGTQADLYTLTGTHVACWTTSGTEINLNLEGLSHGIFLVRVLPPGHPPVILKLLLTP